MAKHNGVDELARRKILEIHEWTLSKAKALCSTCSVEDTCCGDNHQLIGSFDTDELPFFVSRGVPVIVSGKFDDGSAVAWACHGINRSKGSDLKIVDKLGRNLPEPSMVAYPSSFNGRFGVYFLYTGSAGVCPFYDKESHECKFHDAPDRPDVCKSYPVFAYHLPSQPEIEVAISHRCYGFNAPEVLSDFVKTFSAKVPPKKERRKNLAFIVNVLEEKNHD